MSCDTFGNARGEKKSLTFLFLSLFRFVCLFVASYINIDKLLQINEQLMNNDISINIENNDVEKEIIIFSSLKLMSFFVRKWMKIYCYTIWLICLFGIRKSIEIKKNISPFCLYTQKVLSLYENEMIRIFWFHLYYLQLLLVVSLFHVIFVHNHNFLCVCDM